MSIETFYTDEFKMVVDPITYADQNQVSVVITLYPSEISAGGIADTQLAALRIALDALALKGRVK